MVGTICTGVVLVCATVSFCVIVITLELGLATALTDIESSYTGLTG
jgi:hypothetical protein